MRAEKHIETLKDCLTTAPILAYPIADVELIMDTDASGFAIGAVLSQVHDMGIAVSNVLSVYLTKYEVQISTY